MLTSHILIYLILLTLAFINILVPFSGSVTVAPLLATLTTTHIAIGLTSFYFFIVCLIRVAFFWKEIRWEYLKKFLPVSLSFGALGAFALIAIPETVVAILLAIFLLYFFIKAIQGGDRKENISKQHKYTLGVVGAISGFLQGSGLSGSDLRNGYLYAEGLSLAQVHGTTAFIGGSTFLLATIIRLFTNQLQIPDLSIIFYLIPFLILVTYLGKKVIYRMNEKYSRILVIVIMGIALGSILIKLGKLLY